jgi:diguanylate cyclase (GGDEF)-like protein
MVLLALAAPVAGVVEARPGHARAHASSHGGGQGKWDGGRGGGDRQRGGGDSGARGDGGGAKHGDGGNGPGSGGAGDAGQRGDAVSSGDQSGSAGAGDGAGRQRGNSHGGGGQAGDDHSSGGGDGSGREKAGRGRSRGEKSGGGKARGEKSGGDGSGREKAGRGRFGREASGGGKSRERSGAGLPSRFGRGSDQGGRLPIGPSPGSLGTPTSSSSGSSTPTPGPVQAPGGAGIAPAAVVPPAAPPAVTPQPGRGATAPGSRLGQVLTTVFPASASPAGLVSAAGPATTGGSPPARRTGEPRSRGGGTPAPPSNPVSRVIEAIPTAIWFVLGGLAALALALAGTALVAGARARRRGHAIQAIEGLAISDALTGVLNRGAFEERLRGELARARRYNRPLGLLTFDVAGLKAVNDAHGHSAGDEVLKSVAGVITASIRDHDLCGRMGGDEYAVVVTEQSRAGAERVLERIQAEVPKRREALGLRTDWGLSAGIAEFPNDGDTAEALLKAADRRLYLSRGIHIQPVS